MKTTSLTMYEDAQSYVVVSDRSDFVVTPLGEGLYEDSSCTDDPCQPTIFNNLALAEAVAYAMCVDRAGFCSLWRVKTLPAGCDTSGLAIFALPEFADEAARLHDIFGLDVPAMASAVS